MMYRLVVLTLFSLILGFTGTGYAQEGAKPPLSKGRIAGEFFAGVVGGVAGTAAAVIPFYLLMSLFPLEPGAGPVGVFVTSSEVVTVCAYLCLPVGYAIGSAAGVYLVGNIGKETGSFKYPLIGASLVVIGGLAAAFLSMDTTFSVLIGTLVGAPAVAVWVFNSTRRYKTDIALGKMRF